MNVFKCEWKEDEDGVWWTDCLKKGASKDTHNAFIFEDWTRGPKENGFKYCPYCGEVIKQTRHREEG